MCKERIPRSRSLACSARPAPAIDRKPSLPYYPLLLLFSAQFAGRPLSGVALRLIVCF